MMLTNGWFDGSPMRAVAGAGGPGWRGMKCGALLVFSRLRGVPSSSLACWIYLRMSASPSSSCSHLS